MRTCIFLLQWGRRLPSGCDVEDILNQADARKLQWGRRLPSGCDVRNRHFAICSSRLQWGRRLPSGCDTPNYSFGQLSNTLQWGRRLPSGCDSVLPDALPMRFSRSISANRIFSLSPRNISWCLIFGNLHSIPIADSPGFFRPLQVRAGVIPRLRGGEERSRVRNDRGTQGRNIPVRASQTRGETRAP